MKFRTILILTFIVAAVSMTAPFGYSYLTGPRSLVGPPQPETLASLEGFKAGANVTYKILSPGEKPVMGQQIVGDDGNINIPANGMCQDTDTSLTYDFSIQEDSTEDPVTLTFNLDTGSGEISMSGKGLSEYGAVSFSDEMKQHIDGKADWAGVFRHRGKWNLDAQKKNNFEFVFFDNDIAKDIPLNPRIIKIFTAPGGGGFAGTGVNAYKNIWCEKLVRSTRMVPSTCDPEEMDEYKLPDGGVCPMNHMRIAAHNIMENYVRALKMMTNEFAVIMVKQVQIIGTFIDAKQQLETQRELQLLTAQAHKDYMPSDTMCRFGSFIKSVPRTEQKASLNKQAMNDILMGAYTNLNDTSASEGYDMDIEARLTQFKRVYCDPKDNNDGLAFMCQHDDDENLLNSVPGDPVPRGNGAPDIMYDPPPPGSVNGGPRPVSNPRKNKDIDFGRTADNPYTLNIDFNDTTLTNDEEDALALARNIYWPRPLQPAMARPLKNYAQRYMDMRHILAMQNVAHNSFIEIMAMKARAERQVDPVTNQEVSGWNFMKSMMREYGMSDDEINTLLGDYPSYYAQMEVLTKKMYQNPDFYTNLYDKPANIDRITASMDAIRVMQQRDQYESRLRQEMLTSMMLEEALAAKQGKPNNRQTSGP
jgi:hypothetical protein